MGCNCRPLRDSQVVGENSGLCQQLRFFFHMFRLPLLVMCSLSIMPKLNNYTCLMPLVYELAPYIKSSFLPCKHYYSVNINQWFKPHTHNPRQFFCCISDEKQNSSVKECNSSSILMRIYSANRTTKPKITQHIKPLRSCVYICV